MVAGSRYDDKCAVLCSRETDVADRLHEHVEILIDESIDVFERSFHLGIKFVCRPCKVADAVAS